MQIPDKNTSNSRLKVAVLVLILACALIWGKHWLGTLSQITEVSKDELVIAVVERGDLVIEIRAPGTIVPIASNFIAATSNGRVKEVGLEVGESVEVGSVIMVLENPEILQKVEEAKLEVEVLESAYQALKQGWEQRLLKQRIVVADFKAHYEMIKLRREANAQLVSTGAVSNIDFQESKLREQQLLLQHQLELELLASLPKLEQAELNAAQARTTKEKRHLVLQEKLASELVVRARTRGVIQEVTLDAGEPVKVGTVLARIAEQSKLKAQLRVQESQAKDVIIGQSVVLSAGRQSAHGEVKRIHPTVKEGVVIVDVHFTEALLIGARPDLRIDGTIRLSKVANVLKLKRPVFTQENSSGSLFVLNENNVAHRRQVVFGRSSVESIEIRSTLQEGEQVIVSSMNKYNDVEQVFVR
ncbi:efflux RND transporter periplasmic adaptor subunit [Thalassotalea fusca]